MTGGITLAHFLFAAAFFDVVAVLLMLRTVRLADPQGAEDRRQGRAVILGASIVMAIGFILLALYLPTAQMRIL